MPDERDADRGADEPREVEGKQFERARRDANEPWDDLREQREDEESEKRPPRAGEAR